MAVPFPIARFSVEQYHRMIASGAFDENDALELIDGWVVRKMAKGPAREYATGQCEELLRARVPAGWHVRNQAPITLAASEPEPDVTVVRGARADYRSQHPGAADVALVVEVSDSTLATDRLKGQVYARAAIPTYWIVNLSERTVEVYENPRGGDDAGYGTCRVLRVGDSVALTIEAGRVEDVLVADIVP